MPTPKIPSSIEGVVEIEVFRSMEHRYWLLIEIPHGATRRSEYDAVARKLKSPLPAQLEHFFYVNTDIGTPEGARWIGKTLGAHRVNVVVARCLVPRTFIDTNRVLGGQAGEGLTGSMPTYITDSNDATYLQGLHTQYHRVVDGLYQEICRNSDGLALQLHSYAPRSVGIETVDANIVKALHVAYEPANYSRWPERPAVDLICSTKDGKFHAAPRLVSAAVQAWKEAGVTATENGTYHLHPVTMGMTYAQAFPHQVVCVEMNRGLIADPFVPFGESPISEAKVGQLVAPLARVLHSALSEPV
ncbi:MAG: N-formylglutamate amidohydrolase [Archangium sp.]